MATQASLNFGSSFLVGARVDGEIQHFVIDGCYSIQEARQAVRLGVPGASPVLAVVVVVNKEKMNGNKESSSKDDYSHTGNPDRA